MVVSFTEPDICVPANKEGLEQVTYHHGSIWLVFSSHQQAIGFRALSRCPKHYNVIDNAVEIPLHVCSSMSSETNKDRMNV